MRDFADIPDTDDREERFVSLVFELLANKKSLYEDYASQLLKAKILRLNLDGTPVTLKLTPFGCSHIIGDSQSLIRESGWKRMGWSKTAKRKALPEYIAEAEASVLVQRNT